MTLSARVTDAMIAFYAGDSKRIHHFLTVYGFAKAIGESEGLDAATQEILEIAALTHDIGIRVSEQKYGFYNAEKQQEEGPPVAREMLAKLGCREPLIERVCWLISRHHTYTDIVGADYQILVEADFLINIYGHSMEEPAIRKIQKNIFKTATGLRFLENAFNLNTAAPDD